MPSENILSHFWDLASTDEVKRLKAASELLCALDRAQKQHDEKTKASVSNQCKLFADFLRLSSYY